MQLSIKKSAIFRPLLFLLFRSISVSSPAISTQIKSEISACESNLLSKFCCQFTSHIRGHQPPSQVTIHSATIVRVNDRFATWGAYSKFGLQSRAVIRVGTVIRHWAVIRSFMVYILKEVCCFDRVVMTALYCTALVVCQIHFTHRAAPKLNRVIQSTAAQKGW